MLDHCGPDARRYTEVASAVVVPARGVLTNRWRYKADWMMGGDVAGCPDDGHVIAVSYALANDLEGLRCTELNLQGAFLPPVPRNPPVESRGLRRLRELRALSVALRFVPSLHTLRLSETALVAADFEALAAGLGRNARQCLRTLSICQSPVGPAVPPLICLRTPLESLALTRSTDPWDLNAIAGLLRLSRASLRCLDLSHNSVHNAAGLLDHLADLAGLTSLDLGFLDLDLKLVLSACGQMPGLTSLGIGGHAVFPGHLPSVLQLCRTVSDWGLTPPPPYPLASPHPHSIPHRHPLRVELGPKPIPW